MTAAEHMMRVFNPNALISFDYDYDEWVAIEDVIVPDDQTGRDLAFRVEYRCDDEGTNARAWLLHNPVDWITDWDHRRTHLAETGFICFGLDLYDDESPYDLAFAIPRVRLWCAGYLLTQRSGYEATCEVIPGWKGEL